MHACATGRKNSGRASSSGPRDRMSFTTPTTVRHAVDRLRECGYISGTRADELDPTLTWRLVWADPDASTPDDLSGRGSDLTGQGGMTSQVISSYREEKKIKKAPGPTPKMG